MKIWLTYLGLLVTLGGSDGLLGLAEKQYQNGEYQASIKAYEEALRVYPLHSSRIHFNLAQCYFQLDSVEKALSYYHLSISSQQSLIAGRAANNIGALLERKGQYKEALAAFREALVHDPFNETARYNYELLKKRMGERPVPPSESPLSPPPPPPRQDQGPSVPISPSDIEFEDWIEQIRLRWNPPPGSDDRGAPISDTIPLDRAIRMLELLRRNETQFIQQLRKTSVKPNSHKDRPDW